jgi:hypothetical protein
MVCVATVLSAQDKWPHETVDYKGPCTAYYPRVALSGNSEEVVRNYLKQNLEHLKEEGNGLQLNYIQQSPGGVHVSFTQTYYGVEVYQAEVKLNMDRKNVVRSVFDNTFNTKHWNIAPGSYSSASVIVLHPETGKAIVAERRIENGMEILVEDGQIVYQRDTRSYSGTDSLVTGNIFNPDPLTTLQQPYTTGTFYDNNDANASWLNNQLVSVSFPATFNGTDFRLENSYIKLADVDSPNVLPVVSAVPQFNFNRSQTGFEDVNAFYHLNQYRNHVNSLGFTLANQLITVDAHAWSGSDQSSFTPNGGNPELAFGIGGVDDAEDADVLIHEYAHFISYNAAPGSNIGSQRTSLDEAFGDYAAASYSAALSSYNKDWVFNWDGPVWSNNNLGGRTVASTKVYPTNLTGSIYQNAPIYSTALMNIHNQIGRAATDSLIYQAHYSYAANISMADAAQLLIDADTLLNNGAYYCPIYKHLLDRGLVAFYSGNPCGISSVTKQPMPNVSFTQNGRGFEIHNHGSEPLRFILYSIAGQLIGANDVYHSFYTYNNTHLPNGLYLVELRTPSASQTFKWVKAD